MRLAQGGPPDPQRDGHVEGAGAHENDAPCRGSVAYAEHRFLSDNATPCRERFRRQHDISFGERREGG
jgi:hypothetical protein